MQAEVAWEALHAVPREQPTTAPRDTFPSYPVQVHQCRVVQVLAWAGCARNALTDWQVMT